MRRESRPARTGTPRGPPGPPPTAAGRRGRGPSTSTRWSPTSAASPAGYRPPIGVRASVVLLRTVNVTGLVARSQCQSPHERLACAGTDSGGSSTACAAAVRRCARTLCQPVGGGLPGRVHESAEPRGRTARARRGRIHGSRHGLGVRRQQVSVVGRGGSRRDDQAGSQRPEGCGLGIWAAPAGRGKAGGHPPERHVRRMSAGKANQPVQPERSLGQRHRRKVGDVLVGIRSRRAAGVRALGRLHRRRRATPRGTVARPSLQHLAPNLRICALWDPAGTRLAGVDARQHVAVLVQHLQA